MIFLSTNKSLQLNPAISDPTATGVVVYAAVIDATLIQP